MKNLPIIAILFLLVIGCADSSPKPSTQSTKTAEPAASASSGPSAPPVVVKADALTKAYKSNELAADGQYKNKRLEVTGKVSNIAEVLGTLTADLGGVDLLSVKCSFPESQKDALSKLKTGQTATFIGTGDGMTLSLYVGMRDCSIK